MTRRKQNAPKRLKSTESPNDNPANQNTDDANHVTSDSQEEDEEDGDSTDEDCVKAEAETVSSKDTEIVVSSVLDSIKRETNQETRHGLEGMKKEVILDDSFSDLNKRLKREENGTGDDLQPSTEEKSKILTYVNDNKPVSSAQSTKGGDVKLESNQPPLSPLTSDMSPLTSLSKVRDAAPQTTATNMASYGTRTPPSSLSEDQPLDLSRRPDKLSVPTSSADLRRPSVTHHKVKSSSPLSFPSTNGLSSLQSLQQRFGGSTPIEHARRPGGSSSVIALQPSMTPKGLSSSSSSSALHPTAEELLRLQNAAATSRSKLGLMGDWVDKGDGGRVSRSPSNSPSRSKGESSNHPQPLIPPSEDNSGAEARSKHTIHRCSCQKSFNSLYAMSLHIQETGHTPLSGKSVSLMDYPKLVRGQDMWLNQESEQTRRILRCMQCGESFKSLPLLTVHMMQTQHYTKIVSAEHGRRSHKCSTYCDRDLDRECIFKCKVCQDAFTDMEGLANHMIVSGHHKKQASRIVPPQSSVIDSGNSLTSSLRHGKRKRFLHEEDQGSNGFTVAHLLEYKRKHQSSLTNGMGKEASVLKSPPSPSPPCRLVMCDSCGKKVEAHSFDGHVRACLRQRAEVIDALKTKLATEEALLSRSESKLLKSGFALSSLSSSSYEDPVASKFVSREKGKEEFAQRKRTHSDTTATTTTTAATTVTTDNNVSGLSPKLISKFKQEGMAWSACEKRSSRSLEKNPPENKCEKESDLVEVPLQQWLVSSGDGRLSDKPGGNDRVRNVTGSPLSSSPYDLSKHGQSGAKIKEEVASPSPGSVERGGHGHASDSEEGRCGSEPIVGNNSLEGSLNKGFANSDIMPDSEKDSGDYSTSALHKLDMFSRGLAPPKTLLREFKLSQSPPSRNTSRRTTATTDANANVSDAKRLKTLKSASSSTQVSSLSRVSPSSASSLAGEGIKSESPDSQPRAVSFDILDPNADEGDHPEGGALEAMESFIKKSFSNKSEIRTSNLVSMFSPFGNSFPLPGSIPGTPGIPLNPADPSAASFAKFSKFFSMVPAVGMMSPPTGHGPTGQGLAGRNASSSELTSKTSNKRPFSKNDNACSSPPLKIPAVKLPNTANFTQWKNGVQTKGHVDMTSDSKVKMANKRIEKPTSTYNNSQAKRLKYHNACSDSSLLHNGESRLPSSVELYERQDYLRKQRKVPAGESGTTSKSPGLDNDCGEEKKARIKLEKDDNFDGKDSYEEDAESESEETKESAVVDEVRSRKIGYFSQRHSLKTQRKDPLNFLRNSSPHSPSPEIHKRENGSPYTDDSVQQQASSPVGSTNDEGLSSPVADNFLTSKDCESPYGHCAPEKLALGDDLSMKTRASCSSPESVHSDSMVTRGDNSRSLIRQRSNSMEDISSCRGNLSFRDFKSSRHSVQTWGNERRLRHPNGIDKEPEPLESEENRDIDNLEQHGQSMCGDVISERTALTISDEGEGSTFKNRSALRKLSPEPRVGNGEEKERNGPGSDSGGEIEEYGNNIVSFANGNIYTKPTTAKHDIPKSTSSNGRGGDEYGGGGEDEADEEGDENTEAGRRRANSRLNANKNGDKEEEEEEDEENYNIEEVDEKRKNKASALDSLSSFVYSQPLTSEHPLDSLQRLFTAREAAHLASNGQHLSVAPSNLSHSHSHQESSCSPLNLTTKGNDNICGGGAAAAAADSLSGEDLDNEEVENEAEFSEGCGGEGELTEYKCAACNRRFASKGSYRYHLSRCHLSSVKKYGIKEAFNMSPYVYLPLDHTAKFSKYYQLAQELANKGK